MLLVLVVPFSLSPCLFVSPIKPVIFFSTLFTNTVNQCFPLNATDQDYDPYKKTGTILASYILLKPVAARSKTRVCGRSLARVVGSNPTVGMCVCCVMFCEVEVSAMADPSAIRVLPTVVCLSVI